MREAMVVLVAAMGTIAVLNLVAGHQVDQAQNARLTVLEGHAVAKGKELMQLQARVEDLQRLVLAQDKDLAMLLPPEGMELPEKRAAY